MNYTNLKLGKLRFTKRAFAWLASAGFLVMSFSSFSADYSDWTLLNEVDGVKFYAKTSDCGGENFYVVKVENDNTYSVQVEYSLEMPALPVRGPQTGNIANLDANQSEVGSCDNELKLPVIKAANNETNIRVEATITQN